MINTKDKEQKDFHKEHYMKILQEKSYDGFINQNSIWYYTKL